MHKPTLNHSYRLVWSVSQDAFVAVAEHTRSQRKGGRRSACTVLAAALLSGPLAAADLPTGANVVGGSGSISQNGNAMTIQQNSSKLAIDWNSFNVGKGNSVTFNQPGRDAVALNRVLGSDVSLIQGAINANGQVFLVNPNGVLFTPSAQVNVGGIVASTLNISTSDFMAGNYQFAGDSSNAIVNQGNITAAPGGTIALIAAKITNSGTLNATSGNVLLGAGSRVTLDLGGPVKLEVEQAALDALIEQGGAIKADGGKVYLTAKAAGDLASTVINHTGIIEAQTLATGEKGEIVLLGDMHNDSIQVAGTLDASAPNRGDGGFIETSAAKVRIDDTLKITTKAKPDAKTGTWSIDPNDYTIAKSGGDVTGAQVSSALQHSNVIIQTMLGATAGNGDIFVNDKIDWSSNELTLHAERNININAPLNAGATGRLALHYGQSTTNGVVGGQTSVYTINAPVSISTAGGFSTKLGSSGALTNYTLINDRAGLEAIANDLDGRYALGRSLDLSGTNWQPLGSISSPFRGRLEGLGNELTNLNIPNSGGNTGGMPGMNAEGNGFFRVLSGAYVGNLNLIDAKLIGAGYHGLLAGRAHSSSRIHNIFVSGSIDGVGESVGGLFGQVGGYDTTTFSYQGGATITNSHTMVNVRSAGRFVGGLVGYVYDRGNSQISQSSASGSVIGSRYVGGLFGVHGLNNTTQDSYSVASVNGGGYVEVGGLIGTNYGTLNRVWASGTLAGTTGGGLIGEHSVGSISNSYWDTASTGRNTSAGSGAAGHANFFNKAVFDSVGFDFNNVWIMVDGQTRPFLRSEWSANIRNAHQLQLMSMRVGADYTLAASIDLGTVLTKQGEMWRGSLSGSNFQGSFSPVASLARQPFTGSFNGNGHTLSNLYINKDHLNSANADSVGLFGLASNASINNLRLYRPFISGQQSVGALLGQGLQVQLDNITIEDADVRGTMYYAGGLVGDLSGTQSRISGSVVQGGSVEALGGVGGLAGQLQDGSITNSAAHASVMASGTDVGGLAGILYYGSVASSYATGNVSAAGQGYVGGLVGSSVGGSISDSYATGAVSGNQKIGGLVGQGYQGSITRSYASGQITGNSELGGLIADNTQVNVINSFWNTDTTGVQVSEGGTGRTNLQMQDISTFATAGWSIQTVTDDGSYVYPYLGMGTGATTWRISLPPVDVTYGLGNLGGSYVYKGSAYALGSLWDTSSIFGSGYADWVLGTDYQFTYNGQAISGLTNAGSYTGIGIDILKSGYRVAASGNSLGSLTITPKALSVVGTTVTGKTYDGSALASVNAGSLQGLVAGETLGVTASGLFDSANAGLQGATVSYALSNGSGLTSNYTVVADTRHSATIARRVLGISGTSVAGKTYDGNTAAPVTAGTLSNLVAGETLGLSANGLFDSANVGLRDATVNYTLSNGTGLAGNYSLAATQHQANIGQRAITVVADAKSKVYGNTDPSLTWSVTAGNLVGSDTLGGALTRASGENVGNYLIDASALSNGNYLITKQNGTLNISPRPITVAADARNKVYGNTDPTLSWSVTAGNLVGSDTLSGALTRASGENVGNYLIDASALSNGNYLITKQNGTLSISPRPITVAADARNKVYGNTDPTLSWSVTAGNLVGSDTLSGALTRASGENVGNYLIDASALSNGNYLVTAQNGTLSISPRPLSIAIDSLAKVYGETDPDLTWHITAGHLVGSDTLSGALTRASGENVGTYLIDASALGNGNYLITAQNGTLNISPRSITVSADSLAKVYGNTDPTLTWSVTAGNLVGSDTLSGALTRASGENVGNYLIDASALSNGNYLITAQNGTLSISPRPITVSANSLTKGYGNADPALSWRVTAGNLVSGDTLNGALTRASGEDIGSYLIDASALANGNYLITAVNGMLTIQDGRQTEGAQASAQATTGLPANAHSSRPPLLRQLPGGDGLNFVVVDPSSATLPAVQAGAAQVLQVGTGIRLEDEI